MYVGASTFGDLAGRGPGEWKGVPRDTGWQQDIVDARWLAIGQPPPAPLVPVTMIGWGPRSTRGLRMLEVTPATKNLDELKKRGVKWSKKGWRGVTKEENDFLNFFGKVAVDPYRKQSGISKVAGGILQVASVVFPAAGYMQAVATAGNAALAQGKKGGDEKLAIRVMTPAIEAQTAAKSAEAAKIFQSQLDTLKSLTPTSSTPINFTAAPVTGVSEPPTKPGMSTTEKLLAAAAAYLLLVGLAS